MMENIRRTMQVPNTRRKAMALPPEKYDGSIDRFYRWWEDCRIYMLDAWITSLHDKTLFTLSTMMEGAAAVF